MTGSRLQMFPIFHRIGALVVPLLCFLRSEAATAGINAWTALGTEVRVSVLEVDRQEPDHLYGAEDFAYDGSQPPPSFLRSLDRGATWEALPIHSIAAPRFLHDVVVDPYDSTHLWAAGLTIRQGSVPPTLFSSFDGGDTWDTTPAPSGCLKFLDLVVDPLESRRLYWMTTLWVTGHCPSPPTCSTFKSEDSGANWTCIGYEHYPTVAPSPFQAGEVLKVSYAGIFLSHDFGETWTQVAELPEIPGGGGDQHLPAYFVDVAWASPTTAYATNLGSGLFVSQDGGRTWAPVDGPPSSLSHPWLMELVVDPFHPAKVYALARPNYDSYYAFTVVATDDGGVTWTELADGLNGSELVNLKMDPTTPNRLYVTPLSGGILAYDVQLPEPCVPSATALCITDGRFRIESLWRDFSGNSGVGHAVPLAADTGAFWFFDPDNLELFAKEIDGVGYNNAFWTFYGALSNVEFTLLATDTETGAQHGYFNRSTQFASRGDIESFPQGVGAAAQASTARPVSAPRRFWAAPLRSTDSCTPSATTLCLQGGRFAASVTWRDFAGRTGVGTPLVLTPDTGSFWFFDAGIHELAVKVIDGRGTNDAYWVFYGSLSNVEFELTVVDTETGEIWTRENPSGTFASGGDIEAFPQLP